MQFPLSLATLLAAFGGLTAAPPVVTLPKEVPGEVSAFVTIRADVKDAKAVKYLPLDAGLSVFPADLLTDKTVTVVVAQRPGRYRVLAYAGNADGASEPAVTTVVIGGAVPPPAEPPVDPPVVAPAKLVVLVVEETAAAAATRGALFADPALAARMTAKGHRWRIADKDVVGVDGKPPADLLRFLSAAGGRPMPQVFLVDERGKTRVQTDLPLRAADLLALITKYGG